MNVVNLLPLEKDETVSAMVKIPAEENRKYLCMVTKKGIIKRTDINEYQHIRQSGIIAINLDEGDELAYVEITDGQRKLVVATHDGMSICFDEADARLIGRTARGVRAISLADGDYVVGFAASLGDILFLRFPKQASAERAALMITEYKAAAEKVLLITERHSTEK